MNISEHWTRVKAQEGRPVTVYGALIGRQVDNIMHYASNDDDASSPQAVPNQDQKMTAVNPRKRTASSNLILAIGNDSTTPQGNITSNSSETIPPPLDTVVGIEPIEMKITDEEVTLR